MKKRGNYLLIAVFIVVVFLLVALVYMGTSKEPMDIEDYKNVVNHIFLQELSYEQAFTDEYGYKMNYFGIDYNHHESITIPAEVFSKESGKFIIKI